MPHWPTLQWQLIRPYGRHAYYTLFPHRRPDYFRRPWTYPQGRPDASAPVCFFLPMTDWHARIQRSQQLARAIAQSGAQAVYVNPHLGLEYLRPYVFDPHTRIAILAPRLFELHVHLPREHELHTRPLTAQESSRIAREIATVAGAAPVHSAALVIGFPAWLEAAEQLRRRYGFPIVYDCHDWLPGFGRTPPALLDMEGALFRAADLVVFSSQWLKDRVLQDHPVESKSVLIRNAAEPFAGSEPRAPRAAGPKTAGYVGALDHWFDVDAVAAVAAGHPDWRVVLAGRVEDRRVLQLQKFQNVAFLGEIPRPRVEALLQEWDIAMIPFLVNDLTLAANPIKLYEYFSAGLPVVSSRLPEVALYGDLVYLAGSPAAFSEMAGVAMREQDAARREKRVQTAARETWPERAGRLLECVRSLSTGAPLPERP